MNKRQKYKAKSVYLIYNENIGELHFKSEEFLKAFEIVANAIYSLRVALLKTGFQGEKFYYVLCMVLK